MVFFRLIVTVCVVLLAACGEKPRVVQQPTSEPPNGPSQGETIDRDKSGPTSQDQPARGLSDIRILVNQAFDRLSLVGAQRSEHLVVEAREGKIRVFERQGKMLRFLDEGSGFRFLPAAAPLELEGVRYRGLLDIFINPLGQAVAVNQVDLESYLRGVVPNELGPVTFPYLEALKAQAVAARTFAVAGLGTFARRGFDLYSDSRSQVYTGSSNEHPLSNRAVIETRGLVVSYQGKPIAAFYSSTCGGITEDYSRVFSGDPIPYLRGGIECTDQLSPYHSWSTRVALDEHQPALAKRLAIDCLTDLKLLHRDNAGRVEAIQFVGREHRETLGANDFRVVLGLRSNYILELDTQQDSRGCIRELSVRGKGWGHGVGLCQMGSVSMAQRGGMYEEILSHYYPGTRLINWYQ